MIAHLTACCVDWRAALAVALRSRRRPRLDAAQPTDGAKPAAADGKNKITIAMIAKSSTNPVFLAARTGAEAAAKELSEKNGIHVEIVVAHAAAGRRPGPGAAHPAGRERRRRRDPHLVLRRRQGDRRDQRRRRPRRAGDDVRQRRAAVEALRVLRRRRHQDRPADDGRAGDADERQGQGRDSRRQPERAEPAASRAGRARTKRRSIPASQIVGTFNHIETPQDAAAEVVRVNNAYPDIQGWAMIGGWPLFTQHAAHRPQSRRA